MIGYALKRFLGALPTLFIIVTVAFFMMRAAPGGPFDAARKLPPEIERNVKAAYNLDKPLIVQYGIYLERLAQGDLGPSFKNKDFTVAQLIGIGLPVSMRLGLLAMALAISLGVSLGVWAALRQNQWQDYSVMTVAMFGITVPTFVTAPLLTLLFGVYGVHIFGLEFNLPVGGWNGGAWRNMALPVVVLILLSTLNGVDVNLERAAASLGASRWRIFTRIVVPLAAPGLASAALFAFLTSFDELLISLFLADVRMQTLPVRIWNSLQLDVQPTIAAVNAFLIGVTGLVLLGEATLRRSRAHASPAARAHDAHR